MLDETALPQATEPDQALAAVVALRKMANSLEFAAVSSAIEQGWSWAQIAEALGVTRQAAHKRHAHRLRTRPAGRKS